MVRRGQTFNVSVTFNRQFKPDEDELKLVFEFGRMVGYEILIAKHSHFSTYNMTYAVVSFIVK